MKQRLDTLFAVTRKASSSLGCALRLGQHMMAALLCPERATLTNLICTSGLQHLDWSAHYRLYSRHRVDERVLFAQVCESVQQALPAGHPLVIAMDDTLIRKTGPHISGVGWKRDPLGPAFQTNLVRGQRYLQFSAAWPLEQGAARLVPVGFHHAPSPPKPPKGATPEQQREHRETYKQRNLNAQTLAQMKLLREETPGARPIIFTGDGSYTNKSVLRGLPAGCTYLGRMRKDAVLHDPPEPAAGKPAGRRPSYGALAPTPEELRSDENVPWRKIEAFAAGKRHEFRIKTLGPVLWRKAGAGQRVRIIVIAPLGYRLREGARLLYRQAAYLLCSDPEQPVERLLQYYLWRWGIEVNFREEKQLIGTGQAQVRGAASNQHQPAVSVAAYALLWSAALQSHREAEGGLIHVQRPLWRGPAKSSGSLPSTGDLLRQLRFETWAKSLQAESLSQFVNPRQANTNAEKPAPSLPAMLFSTA